MSNLIRGGEFSHHLCNCQCHRIAGARCGVTHCGCQPCPSCGQRIQMIYLGQHQAVCQPAVKPPKEVKNTCHIPVDYLCFCLCHQNKEIVHSRPCCQECPICHQHIKEGDYEYHLVDCVEWMMSK